MAFFAVILLLASVFHMLAPETAWYLHIGWKLRDAEPSDGYLAFLRVSGGIGCVAAVIMIVVSFVNAPRSPGLADTDWLNAVQSKVTLQDVAYMTTDMSLSTDKALSDKQVNALIPIVRNDLAGAAPLGSVMTVTSYDAQLNIKFDDGSGVSIYDIGGDGNLEIGPLYNGVSMATFSFQDPTLTSKIEKLQSNG